MEEIQRKYPWIVYEEEGEILGYAYGSPEFARAAYQWTVEASVYVAEKAKSRGIGTLLYDTLLDILKKQNFCLCYVLIIAENEASLRMHEKYGFRENGRFIKSGYKLGAWHDVVMMEKPLNEQKIPPEKIIPIGEIEYDFC